MRTEDLPLLQEIVRRIVEAARPERIILFGSYARGDAGPDSDLDLLVVVDADRIRTGSLRAESVYLRRILRGLLTPIDVIVATPEQLERHKQTVGLIYYSALSEGKELYARTAAI